MGEIYTSTPSLSHFNRLSLFFDFLLTLTDDEKVTVKARFFTLDGYLKNAPHELESIPASMETINPEDDSFQGQFHVFLTKIHLSKEALKELNTHFTKRTKFSVKKKVRLLNELTKKEQFELEEKFRKAIKKNSLEKYIVNFEKDGIEAAVGGPFLSVYFSLSCRSHLMVILSKFVEELNKGILQYEMYLPSDQRHLGIKLRGCCNTVDLGDSFRVV